MLSEKKEILTAFIKPLARAITNVNPNSLTLLGLLTSLAAGYLFALGDSIEGGVLLLVSGFFDVLDGAVARENGRVTRFGGFLDSVCDRYADSAVFVGIMYAGYPVQRDLWLAAAFALVGSLMVSYTRARAGEVGASSLPGLAERAERLLLVSIGAVAGYLYWAVVAVAVLSHITVLQRVLVARDMLRR
ncbi:MAG TPA: CDP-alcohol phosphatidyltransferase family protein [Candidatus Methanoperedenaceae archaeon]|nr:CDP-alcohol phosphatidyltransferase family protein [Candidatus Methanoperedenaceae archaeon]